ncbi:unnamed protein product [Rhodiola kirilowii]
MPGENPSISHIKWSPISASAFKFSLESLTPRSKN